MAKEVERLLGRGSVLQPALSSTEAKQRTRLIGMISHQELLTSLPIELAERVRPIGGKPLGSGGKFVLYWMRTAIRVDENQALSVAIELANQLKLPLLVYQGLSERYPYASDRHHTFVLQGARDVQQTFADRNIPYVLHVDRNENRGPHLKTLANQAVLVVTEDMPTEPIRRWTNHLSRSIGCRLLAVDTACVVPMQLVGKSYERAYAFRNATKKLYAERIENPPEEFKPPSVTTASIDLPFKPVDLTEVSIADLVGQCEVDHSIGPVPHTTGGSVAGYARWETFKRDSIKLYAGRRNNPLADGISRLSPYLHYGMIAPTRIAREANEEASDGGEKYLDELLIWRELAYSFLPLPS